jgi:AraC-like DNA-binding protein
LQLSVQITVPTVPILQTVVRNTEDQRRHERTLRLDQDTFMVRNRGDATPIAATESGWAFVFTPAQLARALEGAPVPQFREHIRIKEGPLGTRLRTLERAVRWGNPSPPWLDDQAVELLKSLLRSEQELDQLANRIDCVKSATRLELMRRVFLASDFIHSHFDQPIRLDDIAQAARLSRFHLTRLFGRVLGVTPHGFLLNKRLSVARRLLAECDGDLNQIAVASGFGNRWSLFRRLQAEHGSGGRALRGRPVAMSSHAAVQASCE